MKVIKRFSSLLLIFALASLAAHAQQKRTPAHKGQKPAVVVSEPTLDTLLAADSYKIYGEVRGVGQLIRSNSVNDILEPVMKLAGPPKEFKSLVKWLNTHADEVMTSRILVATWPTAKDVPDVVVAVEFATAEEAARFEPQLNAFLSRVLPTPTPEGSPQSLDEPNSSTPGEKRTEPMPAKPGFYLKRAGSLILVTPTPVTLRKLRPKGSKLLSEDANFRTARNRFSSESVFIFIDVKSMEREEEERRKRYEEENKKSQAEAAKQKSEDVSNEDNAREANKADEPREEAKAPATVESVELETTLKSATSLPPQEAAKPDPVSTALSMFASLFFSSQPKWPDAIGIAISFDNDSFDARALMVTAPGEKCDSVPFLPILIPGPAFVPESPSILPADTELFVTMSLDLPQIYSTMSKPPPTLEIRPGTGEMQAVKELEFESPFAALEKQLGIKVKDDLLPLLGSEIVLSLPVKELDIVGPPGPSVPRPDTNEASSTNRKQPGGPSPVIAISLKDKEGMRLLLPKIVDSLGFKGASALAQTERREDTEIVSFADVFSYAFIGNFLCLSADAASTRHVVDSYMKHETLSADAQFKNYTRWQPRQLQGQVYVSPALMESYKSWADQPSALISDQTREFLTRLSVVAQPITYSLSNEGLGPLHELHIPKNLVLMAIAGISGEANPPPSVANERMAIGALYMIANAEGRYKTEKGAGSYATLAQLIAEDMVSREMVENHGYKLDVTFSGNGFEGSAVPMEYGRTGRMSYFVDQTGVVRGGDHGGGPATSADTPIR